MLTYYTLSFDDTMIKDGDKVTVYKLVPISPNQIDDSTASWPSHPELKPGDKHLLRVNGQFEIVMVLTNNKVRTLSRRELDANK